VFLASLVAAQASMMFAAAERTTEIDASRVAGMSDEANIAVRALDRASSQFRMVGEKGIESRLILTDKRFDLIILMPVGTIREQLLDADNKKARFSVRIWYCTPSSYFLDAKASRGRPRFFVALRKNL